MQWVVSVVNPHSRLAYLPTWLRQPRKSGAQYELTALLDVVTTVPVNGGGVVAGRTPYGGLGMLRGLNPDAVITLRGGR